MSAIPAAQPIAPPNAAAASAKQRSAKRFPHNKPAWLFIAPFAIFYLLFLIWPTIYMIVSSFFNTSLVKSGLGSFAGLANYQEMLTKDEFWSSLWHTMQFTLYTVPPLVILAFVFAILVNRLAAGSGSFRIAFFLPFILPSATISLIWLFIFTPGNGLLALVQGWLGFDAPRPVLGDAEPGHDRDRVGDDLVDARVQLHPLPGGAAGRPPRDI